MKKLNGKAPPLKLDLGCGENKREGFLGVDLFAAADYQVDLMKFPWPFKDASTEEVFCSHFLEHVPGPLRIKWMDELYRILIPGGKATIVTPYWSSPRAIQDPTHQWPPLVENSFLYFNKDWRVQNKLTHYLGKCDFDFNYGYILDMETAQKSQETQQFYIRHYVNAVSDLQVNLVKRDESNNGTVPKRS
jgi:ubiquinone/menaquinone biosynthesis C-methylase UbiE